jgi:hypothetical protein
VRPQAWACAVTRAIRAASGSSGSIYLKDTSASRAASASARGEAPP